MIIYGSVHAPKGKSLCFVYTTSLIYSGVVRSCLSELAIKSPWSLNCLYSSLELQYSDPPVLSLAITLIEIVIICIISVNWYCFKSSACSQFSNPNNRHAFIRIQIIFTEFYSSLKYSYKL